MNVVVDNINFVWRHFCDDMEILLNRFVVTLKRKKKMKAKT